jgi:hypothetical protein
VHPEHFFHIDRGHCFHIEKYRFFHIQLSGLIPNFRIQFQIRCGHAKIPIGINFSLEKQEIGEYLVKDL